MDGASGDKREMWDARSVLRERTKQWKNVQSTTSTNGIVLDHRELDQ